jgi:hypothetical protein
LEVVENYRSSYLKQTHDAKLEEVVAAYLTTTHRRILTIAIYWHELLLALKHLQRVLLVDLPHLHRESPVVI